MNEAGAVDVDHDAQPQPKLGDDGGFYIYCAHVYARALVHKAKCPRNRKRQGNMSDAGSWSGPYATKEEALGAARSWGAEKVAGCRCCRP
jgi:hypothetical protein